jgi:hypothetical protein
VRLRAILDYGKTFRFSYLKNRVHVARPSGKVNRNDCFRSRRKFAENCLSGDVLAEWVYISQNRGSADGYDAAGGCNEGAARSDDLGARPDVQRAQRKFQGNRSIRNRDCVFGAQVCGILPLKEPALIPRPVIDCAGPQDCNGGFDLFI